MSLAEAMPSTIPPVKRVGKPKPEAPPVATFIFIGDPKDSGRGSRAPRDDDDTDTGSVCKLYGFKFPLGKAVDVPIDAKIGPLSVILVVDKLRGNSHFFEGTEAELKAAKASGELVFTKAPPKVKMLVKHLGLPMKLTEDKRAYTPDESDDG